MVRRTMRRMGTARRRPGFFFIAIAVLALAVMPAAAQQGGINPRLPPPPPPAEEPPSKPAPGNDGGLKPNAPPLTAEPSTPAKPPEPAAPPPDLPASVAVPAGTRFAVVLDTPLSTRISRKGQVVTFRTSDALRLNDQLEIPPETAFTGAVVEVRRPGGFGRAGSLRVKVDRINLDTGATAEVLARLDSPDMKGQGRLTTDNQHTTDLYSLALYTLEGTLLGAQIHGGKGAAVGAGAGAAVALIIMMAHRGRDLYLEPGMPFQILLDRPVDLPGRGVWAAQQNYARAHWTPPPSGNGGEALGGANSSGSERGDVQHNPDGSPVDPDRPKLKRRPRNP